MNWPIRLAVLWLLLRLLDGASTRGASPPVITLQPTNIIVAGGQTRFLSVRAEGDPQPAYQWYLNGEAIARSTNSNHVIFGASTLQQGDYFAIASNAAGTATSDVVTVTVITNAPVILSQSTNVTVTAGQDVTLAVNATGLPPPAFAWFFNETNRLVSPTFNLAFRPAHATNSGIYTVVLSNSVRSVTSAPIVLNVSPFPRITTQPTNQTLNESDLLTMRVSALGAMPLHHQWFFEGAPLSGAMGTNFTVPSAYPTNSGRYYCVVSNSAGTATSEVAVISVNAAPMYPGALDVHYKPDTNGWTVSDLILLANDQVLAANTGLDAGLRRLNTDGTIDSSFASNRFSAEKIAIQPDGRILAWWGRFLYRFDTSGVQDTNFAPASIDLPVDIHDIQVQPDGGIVFVGYDSFGPLEPRNYLGRLLPDGRLDRFFRTFEPIQVDGGVEQNSAEIKALAVLPDGALLFPAPALQRRHKNGELDSSFSSTDSQLGSKITAIVPTRDQTVFYIMGTFTNVGSAVRRSFARLDESGALDATFVPSANMPVGVRAAAVQRDGKVVVAGFFVAGTNAVIRLNVDGSIDEAFTPALLGTVETGAIVLAIQSDGKILVGGTFNRVNGRRIHGLARLHGDPPAPPEMIAQPRDTTATVGQRVPLRATVRAFGNANYQWYRGDTLVATETEPHLYLQSVALSDAGEYRLVVATSYGSITSRVARLTVEPNPTTPGAVALDLAANIDGPIYAMEATSDGRYIVAGNFNTVNGVARPGLARINADGSLDTTFDPPEATPRNFLSYIRALGVTQGGSVYIGGGFTNVGGVKRSLIARLHSDGRLDDSFDAGWALPDADEQVNAIAVLSNTQVMAAGSFTYMSNWIDFGTIARFHSNGALDTTFVPAIRGTAHCLSVIDSNTVFVGGTLQRRGSSITVPVFRLLQNGSDDSRAPGGFNSEITFGSSARSMRILPDGKILAGGRFQIPGTNRTCVVRFFPNGTVDRTFMPTPGDHLDSVCAWVADAGCGKVLIGGFFRSVNGQPHRNLARINSDGTLDTSFDSQPIDGAVMTGLILPSGEAVLAGEFQNVRGVRRLHLTRINNGPYLAPRIATPPATHSIAEGGSIDLRIEPPCTFPTPTFQWHFNGAPLDGQTNLTVNFTNTRLYNAGSYTLVLSNSVGVVTSSVAQLTVLRAPREPGAPEIETASIFTSNSVVRCLHTMSGGKVLVGGSFTNLLDVRHRGLVRLNADGSYDNSFVAVITNHVRALAVSPDGTILVNEWLPASPSFDGNSRLSRLHSNGVVDTTFTGSPFYHFFSWTESRDGPRSIVTDATGRPYYGREGYLIGFAGGPAIPVRGNPHVLAWQPDGKLLVGGAFGMIGNVARTNLARLHPTGAVDSAFVPWAGTINAMALQSDGRIIVGGQFTSGGGVVRRGVARFHSDGSLDEDFNPQPGIGGVGPVVNALALQPDGKLIIGGRFTSYDAVPCNNLARLNPDGSLDATFHPGSGVEGNNASVNAVALADDAGILLGGGFTTFNGVPRNSFARAYNNPKVLEFVRAEESSSFSFLSMLDRSYVVEAKSPGENQSWVAIHSTIGDGSIKTITFSNAATDAVLYRLRIE